MGFFDWIAGRRQRPQHPGEAVLGELAAPPSVPQLGQITQFDESHGLGEIALASGAVLRFGASACRGFDPVVSAPVEVLEVGQHPMGGYRATSVRVPRAALAEVDALHDRRESDLGVITGSVEDAVKSALMLGTATVLLVDAPDRARVGVRTLFDQAGVLDEDIRLEFSPAPTLVIGPHHVQVFVGYGPFSTDALDLRFCDDAFSMGAGFVTLALGLPGVELGARMAVGGRPPDLWGESGIMRRLTVAVDRLLVLGRGVIVHRAGQVVYPAERWARHIGDPSDPACRPFAAWIDIGYNRDRTALCTYGLNVSGLPDLSATIHDPDSAEEHDRCQQALLCGCHRMVRENRKLVDGERLLVRATTAIDAYPLPADELDESDSEVLCFRARATALGTVLLEQRPGERPSELWRDAWRNAAAGETVIGLETYRELLLANLGERGLSPIAVELCTDVPASVPAHEVRVFQRADGEYVVCTVGLARRAQPGGSAELESARIEFLLPLAQYHSSVAPALSRLGCYLHGRPDDAPPWQPEHHLVFPEQIGPTREFVLGFAGSISFGDSPAVSLLTPIPIVAEEWTEIDRAGVTEWLQTYANHPDVRGRWL